jgi:hypothetical protein
MQISTKTGVVQAMVFSFGLRKIVEPKEHRTASDELRGAPLGFLILLLKCANSGSKGYLLRVPSNA